MSFLEQSNSRTQEVGWWSLDTGGRRWGVVFLTGVEYQFYEEKKINSRSWLHNNVNVLNNKLST